MCSARVASVPTATSCFQNLTVDVYRLYDVYFLMIDLTNAHALPAAPPPPRNRCASSAYMPRPLPGGSSGRFHHVLLLAVDNASCESWPHRFEGGVSLSATVLEVQRVAVLQ